MVYLFQIVSTQMLDGLMVVRGLLNFWITIFFMAQSEVVGVFGCFELLRVGGEESGGWREGFFEGHRLSLFDQWF